MPLTASTAQRWAREGRLQAIEAERGRLVTRRSWLDAALAAKPYTPRQRPTEPDPDDHDGAVRKHIGRKLRALKGGKA